MTGKDDRTPILVGVGVATQREDDPARSLAPVELMIEAARRAGRDSSLRLLASVGRVAVPKGRWSHSDPGRIIKNAVGAPAAVTVLAEVGVLQQTLIADACRAIAEEGVDAALVVGGDTGHRILRSRLQGLAPPEREDVGPPNVRLRAEEDLMHEAEMTAGLRMPVSVYALLDSAFRACTPVALRDHLAEIGRIYSRFTEVAAANPHAWSRESRTSAEILEASDRNPLQAFPYTKRMCASWNVDQAAALLFCSVGAARAAGVSEGRWVHPWASTESNFMAPMSARADLHACAGARIAGSAALDPFGLAANDLDFVDLYSCFPVAVLSCARELGLSTDRDLTVTGGMPFAGGPFNNYVLQATARLAELLRARPAATGLVASISGLMTKQGFGLWSGHAPPGEGMRFADVSSQVAAATALRPVVSGYDGPGRVAAATVLQERGKRTSVVVADLDDGARTVAACDEPEVADLVERDALAGALVRFQGARFTRALDQA